MRRVTNKVSLGCRQIRGNLSMVICSIIIGNCQSPSSGDYFSISFFNARCNTSTSLSSFKRSAYFSKFCIRNLRDITAKKLDLDFFLATKKFSSSLFRFSCCFSRSFSSAYSEDILFFNSGCFSRILQLLILSQGLSLHVVFI